jgi:hypothetical protein
MNKEKVIMEFLDMKDLAELKALSSYSLENPLTNEQFKRLTEIRKRVNL